jgi:hypothetical protein
MAVPVRSGATFEFGNASIVIDGPCSVATDGRTYDVAPDGRFLMIAMPSGGDIAGAESRLTVATNWQEESKPRVAP